MDNKYENISTCITIVSDDLDTLKTNIINTITNNFENRLSLLGIKRKCPNITFAAGTGSSIDIIYNIMNNVGTVVRTIKLATITYEYDTTNIYLSYDRVRDTNDFNITENINKYSVLLCFTTTETIAGFTILNPSMLVSNNDNTYSVKTAGSDTVITFKQTDAFMPYDSILEQGLNPNDIDFNNLYIRNKLIYNPNCYYELDFTDLIDNDTVKSVPYINDRFYDITEIDSSYTEYSNINTYEICSVLSTTRINYSISDYPVLFPKTITAQDNTVKGYLNYVYDVPTQKIDTGDSINNLYSGQLINLEDSQYVLCDANTVVQIDNLIITGGNTDTTYTGRFHNFDIIYPNDDNIKVFATLTSDPTAIVDAGKGNPINLYDVHIRTPVSESIHSWYQYNYKPDGSYETEDIKGLIESSGVNAGKYDYLYKVCIPSGDATLTEQTPVLKQEYLRLHKVTEVDPGNVLKQYPFIQYIKKYPDEYTPLSYMTSYTTVSSVVKPLLGSNASIKIILQLYKLKPDDIDSSTYEKPPTLDDSVYDEGPGDPIEAEVVYEDETFKIKYHNQVLGEVLFNNTINGTDYGAEIRLFSGMKSNQIYEEFYDAPIRLKYDVLIYHIDDAYYTVSDLVYISYYYLPDLYLEYYGYTNTYIERTDLVGYYVNKDTLVKYNVDDDPNNNNEPRYGLDYYFACGNRVPDYGKEYYILINNIKLYMALDNNGEPGEWNLIVPDDKINHQIYKEFEYSIGPQHTFGYPLYPGNGLPDLPEPSNNSNLTPDDLKKKNEILNEQLEYFSSNTFTGVIWYKIECDNFNTIIDSGTVTITDVPVKEITTIYDTQNPEVITDYKWNDNLADQGIGEGDSDTNAENDNRTPTN